MTNEIQMTSSGFPITQLLKLAYKNHSIWFSLKYPYYKKLRILKDWLAPIDLEIPAEGIRELYVFESNADLADLAQLFGCSQSLIHHHLTIIYQESPSGSLFR